MRTDPDRVPDITTRTWVTIDDSEAWINHVGIGYIVIVDDKEFFESLGEVFWRVFGYMPREVAEKLFEKIASYIRQAL